MLSSQKISDNNYGLLSECLPECTYIRTTPIMVCPLKAGLSFSTAQGALKRGLFKAFMGGLSPNYLRLEDQNIDFCGQIVLYQIQLRLRN